MKIEKPRGSYDTDPPKLPTRDFRMAPEPLRDGPESEGRLRRELSLLTIPGTTAVALARAALLHGSQPLVARASAEMAVTGRRAGAEFVELEQAETTEARALDVLSQAVAPKQPTPKQRAALKEMITHARLVKTWIDSKPSERAAAFKAIANATATERPYVAVLGERDLPARPINVMRTTRTENDVEVHWGTTWSKTGQLRATVRVAHTPGVKTKPDQPVILLLHGLGSVLEETETLSKELAKRGVQSFAVDLPNHGYSERIPFDDLKIDMGQTGKSSSGPFFALETMRAFVGALGDTLIRRFPDLSLGTRLRAVGGGSLGGSLSLLLGLKRPEWLDAAVAWSPGNAWTSFWDDPHDSKKLSIDAERIGRQPLERVRMADEPADARGEYIQATIDGTIPLLETPMWQTWWRGGDYAPAREVHRHGARALRHEVYDRWHRRWCSALAHDQMASSMRNVREDPPLGNWPMDHVKVPVLLMAGDQDNHKFAEIFSASQTLAKRAQKLKQPQGRAVFFENTGHSIHDERPVMLATNIADFLSATLR